MKRSMDEIRGACFSKEGYFGGHRMRIVSGLIIIWLWMLAPSQAATWYVWTNSAANGPGTEWSNAYQDIQSAVDAAVAGDQVWVRPGIYATGGRVAPGMALTNRVVIDKAIALSSSDGAATTIIEGGGSEGPTAIRGVFMTHGACLTGFTVRYGKTMKSGADGDQQGGGIHMADPLCTVKDSVIRDNTALFGGGVFGGVCNGCHLTGNSTQIPSSMMVIAGGGAYQSILNSCLVEHNHSHWCAGGLSGGEAHDCVFQGNSASYNAGATSGAKLYACIVRNNNSASPGAIFSGEAYSTLICNNDTTQNGVVSEALLVNCTIVNNRASDKIGGAYGCTLVNSIVWSNSTHGTWPTPDYMSCSFSNSCAPLLPLTSGNINQSPAFLDWTNGEYLVTSASPCRDAGTTSFWSACTTDYEGQPRWFGAAPDMGADEACVLFKEVVPGPTSFRLEASAIPGQVYAVEESMPGADARWQRSPLSVTATTSLVGFDVMPTNLCRQYRLVTTP